MCVFMLSLELMQFCSPLMVLESCPSYILEMRQREINVKRIIQWKRKNALEKCLNFLVLLARSMAEISTSVYRSWHYCVAFILDVEKGRPLAV